MIVILDYGMGNPSSILNMIRKVGGDATITSDHEVITRAKAIILPGVGSFDNGMQKLNESGLTPLIKKLVLKDKLPFLGICLGMQLLFESSEEGSIPGLGLVKGKVTRFNFDEDSRLKVPHMGWNVVTAKHDCSLYNGFVDESRFYFVHSYYVECDDERDIAATSCYGHQFTCSVQSGNITGVQFHPEKSHKFGIHFFRNFLDLLC
ncbi:imidazole glycerol phosphate synthase subunit HisH [Vibrio sp. RE86]|uniref:imidazole glycerol phosphate synthase subunit HisH n=1 Tax=Vibrio sp. RE86 TaxID=2607605 RepID=UPI0014936DD4|nr:imidazole glycerol phosphate synthase subunit HisH [Vibrio sp. RE86]NOH80815.1 imidazole glycerol phosphate synthase subunit HisH [Vibrio sp. RE86]